MLILISKSHLDLKKSPRSQKVTSISKSVTDILIKSVLIGKKLGLDIEKRAWSGKSCRDLENCPYILKTPPRRQKSSLFRKGCLILLKRAPGSKKSPWSSKVDEIKKPTKPLIYSHHLLIYLKDWKILTFVSAFKIRLNLTLIQITYRLTLKITDYLFRHFNQPSHTLLKITMKSA